MTAAPAPSLLDILSAPAVWPAAAGASVVVLTPALDRVLWSNGGGRALLGAMSQDSSFSLAALSSPSARQVAAARRSVETQSSARVMLRPVGQAFGKPVVADLVRTVLGASATPVVVLTADTGRRADMSESLQAQRILADCGIATEDAGDAAVFGPSGLVAGTIGSISPEAAATAARQFLDGSEAVTETAIGDHVMTFGRVGERLALALLRPQPAAVEVDPETAERPAATDTADEDDARSSGTETVTPSVGAFSVRRQKLPAGRRRMDISTLIQSWHRRDTTPAGLTPPGDDEASIDPAAGAVSSADAFPTEEGIAAASHDDDGRAIPSSETEGEPVSDGENLDARQPEPDGSEEAVASSEAEVSAATEFVASADRVVAAEDASEPDEVTVSDSSPAHSGGSELLPHGATATESAETLFPTADDDGREPEASPAPEAGGEDAADLTSTDTTGRDAAEIAPVDFTASEDAPLTAADGDAATAEAEAGSDAAGAAVEPFVEQLTSEPDGRTDGSGADASLAATDAQADQVVAPGDASEPLEPVGTVPADVVPQDDHPSDPMADVDPIAAAGDEQSAIFDGDPVDDGGEVARAGADAPVEGSSDAAESGYPEADITLSDDMPVTAEAETAGRPEAEADPAEATMVGAAPAETVEDGQSTADELIDGESLPSSETTEAEAAEALRAETVDRQPEPDDATTELEPTQDDASDDADAALLSAADAHAGSQHLSEGDGAPVGEDAGEPELASDEGHIRTAASTDPADGEDRFAAMQDDAATAGETAAMIDPAAAVESEPDDIAPEEAAAPAPAGDGAAAEATPDEAADATPQQAESGIFVPRFDTPPVRFVWQIDRDGRFRSLSPEFAAAVGPRSADVIGRSFREVAQVFGFDAEGEITRLLDRRDTWSGRSILWPVEDSARKVPVDLAALPVYARDRSFDGFRGFGILRMSEAVEDPERIGEILSGRLAAPDRSAQPSEIDGSEAVGSPEQLHAPSGAGPEGTSADDASTSSELVISKPVFRTISTETPPPFGRRMEPPAEQPSDDSAPSKIIRFEDRRRPREGMLSSAEEAAFRFIGETLGGRAEPDEAGPAASTGSSEIGRDDMAGSDRSAVMIAASDDALRPDALRSGPDIAARDDGERPSNDALDPAVSANDADDADFGDDESRGGRAELLPDLQAIYGSLPLPVLVQASGELIYGNRAFFEATGYADVETLSEAGGLDTLFAERDSSLAEGEVALRHADGRLGDARVHLQRITLEGGSCLVMSFAAPQMAEAEPGSQAASTEAVAASGQADLVARLRSEVDELRAVLDTATDGVVLLDSEGLIRSMNGAAHALFGIAENDYAGRPFVTLFAHESQKATLDYLETMKDEGFAGILNDGREVIGRVAQGGFIPLFITLGRLGQGRGWCAVIRDIAHWKRIETDLTNARRQAEAASLHKSQFLANISHELRTPLNAIIGFADVMMAECFGPIGNERYLEYLGDIKRSGHHVLDLVNDLLDISKIEAGKLDLSFEAVSLNEIIAEVVSLMQPQANRERVIVRSNLPSSVPPVVADRRSMRQIALNLLSNAVRFTPSGGQIIVSTTYSLEGDVVLRFRDSGIGMTEREIDIALRPFQQVHASRSRGEGTGLGLPLTKAMVEANRAQFAIMSTPGEGTLVEIVFPSQRVLAD
nr:ATP-binding protein [Mangrovicella endophytica]